MYHALRAGVNDFAAFPLFCVPRRAPVRGAVGAIRPRPGDLNR